MDTIVFVGVNKFGSSRDAIKVAKKLGYYTVLLTNNPKQLDQREEYKEVDLMLKCDLEDEEQLHRVISKVKERNLELKAIVSFVDPWCGTASKLAEEFNLHSFSTDSILKMLDKSESRKILEGTPYNPKYQAIHDLNEVDEEDIKKRLPVVIKLAHSNGSKDVYLCETMDEFHDKIYDLEEKCEHEDAILIEDYLKGPQYLIETLVINGKLNIIAIVEQQIEFLNGHFIVTGYSLLHDYRKDFYQSIKQTIEGILKQFKFKHGPCHFEMRLVSDGWKLIEVNPRVSGSGMNQFVEAGTGINIVKETLKLSLNEEVDLIPRMKKYVYAKYQTIKEKGHLERVTGKRKAIKSPGVFAVHIRPRKGQFLTPPTSMGHRYAIIMATGRNKEEAKYNAEEAVSHITFHLKPLPEDE